MHVVWLFARYPLKEVNSQVKATIFRWLEPGRPLGAAPEEPDEQTNSPIVHCGT
jgi:hypothetical protein